MIEFYNITLIIAVLSVCSIFGLGSASLWNVRYTPLLKITFIISLVTVGISMYGKLSGVWS